MNTRWLVPATSFLFALSLACGDSGGSEAGDDESGTGTGDESGSVGEEASTTNDTTGDGDGDTTGDGDGDTTDMGCPIGSEGCPCTDGGGCDPGLMCESGVCVPEATTGDGDGDTTGDGDGDTTGDGDGDTTGDGDGDGDTTGDGDGDGDMPYGPCPSGDDADCAPGEICVIGAWGMGQNEWSMCTSGTCNDQADCELTPDDACEDLPGDGVGQDYCVPFVCENDPCPDGMECAPGFGGNLPDVCVWPS